MSSSNKLSKKSKEKEQKTNASTQEKQTSSASKVLKSTKAFIQDTRITNPFKSVGLKLLLIIFTSIVACVLTVGLLSYSQAKNLVEKNVSDASFQTVKQVTNNMDVIFQTYVDLSLQLIIDKEVTDNLAALAQAKDQYILLQTTRDLSEKLSSYIMSNNTISGAMLIPIKEGRPVVTAGNAISSSATQIMETDWFKETVELDGRVNWVTPQTEGLGAGSTKSIALSRLLKNMNSSGESYVLLMELPVESFADRYKDVELGEGSELFIVDNEGNYVINNDISLIGTPASVSLPTEGEAAISGDAKLKSADGTEVLAIHNTFKQMDWRLVGTIPVDLLVEDAKVIRNMTWITVALAALIAIMIGVVVILTIAKPLVALRNLMMEGARGNLTVRSRFNKRQDEIGQLSDSFNVMMEQIGDLAVQTTRSAADVLLTSADLTDASKKTAIAAQEIAIATEEIANGATSLAVEAEKGSDLTSSINSQMKNVIDANEQMVKSAMDVEKASEQGTAYMGILIEKTGATEEMTRSMVEKVDALKESTSSIVKILDVLNSVAKQTNILSLNATIEAARAGAAGRGFMVVADEIRKLAEQSRQSIDIVAQITETIQHEIEETVNVLSDAYPLFQEQIGSVKEANQIFLTVQGQMGQFVERLELVTGSIGELDKSQSVLADAMTNVSAVAEESSATSEEVASLSSEQLSISDGLVNLSEKLDAVSRGLKDSLSKFKIE